VIRRAPLECLLDFAAKNPGTSRDKAGKACGVTYWSARYHLEKLSSGGFYWRGKKVEVPWLWKEVKYPRPWARRIYYGVRRHKLRSVWSFKYTEERARELRRKRSVSAERWVEVEAEVDKPVFVEVRPNYVISVLLDYSGWTYTVPGSKRAARLLGLKEWVQEAFPGSLYWVKGDLAEAKSEFRADELKVRVRYTDFDYPENSFERENVFGDSVEKWKAEKIKEEIVGWILRVCSEEFYWGVGK